MRRTLIIILLIINIPVYIKSFKYVFKSKDEFFESLKYENTSDLVSVFKGDILKDMAAEQRWRNFTFIIGIVLLTEYFLITMVLKIFGVNV